MQRIWKEAVIEQPRYTGIHQEGPKKAELSFSLDRPCQFCEFPVNILATALLLYTFPLACVVTTEHYISVSVSAAFRWKTVPTERLPFLGEVSATFEGTGCCMDSATGPYGR
jgi:hypothetical protein